MVGVKAFSCDWIKEEKKKKSNLQSFFMGIHQLVTKLSVLWKLFELSTEFELCAKKFRYCQLLLSAAYNYVSFLLSILFKNNELFG